MLDSLLNPLHKNSLNATPLRLDLSFAPKLFPMIVHRAAKLESLACPIILDMRTLVDRHRVGLQQATGMMVLRW